MRKLTTIKTSIVIYCLLFTCLLFSQVTIGSYDFGSGLQGWTVDGTDSKRGTSTAWSCDTSVGIIWVRNNNVTSIATSPVLDLTSYSSIDFSFCVKVSLLENPEGFIFQYYDGSSWADIKTFTRSNDFPNIGSAYSYNLSISMDSSTYNFDTNSQFRFKGNANQDNEITWIDNILIEGYLSLPQIDFDGLDDHVDCGDDSTFEFSSDFSLEAWVLQETTTTTGTIASKSNAKSGNEKGYKLVLNNGVPNLKWYDNSNTLIVDLISPYEISNNRWYHIAATYDGTNAKLYIDGIEVVSSTPSSAPSYDTEDFMIGATYDSDTPSTPKDYFNGFIDEVRVWNVALNVQQLREMMNQEIQVSTLGDPTNVMGKVIPLEISGDLKWDSLEAYYDMNYDDAGDKSSNSRNGLPKNITTLQDQTAPLPYTTIADGDWDDITGSTPWTLGDSVWDQPNGYGVDRDNPMDPTSATKIDWNIVQLSHNIDSDDEDITLMGLISDTPGKILTMANDTETLDEYNSGQMLWITHYLDLDGKIDLIGESQLIQKKYDATNQTSESTLSTTSAGTIERDQQGTRDLYTYNHWSSPVGEGSLISNNTSFQLPNIFSDGTISSTPASINFLASGYDGATTPTLAIADYWIWKYANNTADQYSQWEHVRSTGTILAGEGFTMKGVSDTAGVITQEQNYVFEGKPNNGDITLTITSGNEYLIGNPYPSALDANEFIKDNIRTEDGGNASTNVINGVLYFWDHFASSTHVLADYEGGYATYTLMGGAAAVSNDARINATLDEGTKIPERYIPVGQGFFVSTILDASLVGEGNDPEIDYAIVGGDITFNNDQRVFKREGVSGVNTGSVFLRSSNAKSNTKEIDTDTRQKIRLMYTSPKGYHRPLLVGVDENASSNFDLGYDGPLVENNKEDLYWVFNNSQFIIQAVDSFDETQILPLGTHIEQEGVATIKIETLENIGEDLKIYIHDKETDSYHDLRESDFQVNLTPGEYLERFEITFANASSLSIEDINTEVIGLQTYYSNEKNSVIIENPDNMHIKSINMYNIIGQSVFNLNKEFNENYKEIKTNTLSVGTYILKLKTKSGTYSKKVLVK